MDQPGGETIMLGQWRIVLRQAEESARAGRLGEALALASRPDLAEYRQAIQLRGRLTQELIERACRRADAEDVTGAIEDLDVAALHSAPPDALAAARLRVAERVAGELHADLETGEPGRVVERVERLAAHQISGPGLRRLRDAAEAWQLAREEARRGEFGRAREGLERAERLAPAPAQAAVTAARAELDRRQTEAAPRVERLYEALGQGHWPGVLAAADAVLELAPEHAAARQARGRAWQQIGGLQERPAMPKRLGPTIPFPGLKPEPRPERTEPERDPGPRSDPGPHGRMLLWADTIGGFLVCLDDQVVLGRATADGQADVALLGDLSRRHATIRRGNGGYVIQAHHDTYINGRKVDEAPLRHGDVIRLGSTVELEFRQPSPVSATARLEFLSRHRLPMAVEAVILMGETCILGPSRQAHILASGLDAPVVLYRKGAALWCRAPGEFEVDGRGYSGRAPLSQRSSVLGEGFSFSVEPLNPHGATA